MSIEKARKIILFALLAASLTTCVSDKTYKPSPTDDPLKVSNNGNLWYKIQNHMALTKDTNRPEVRSSILWWQEHPTYLTRIIYQSSPYLYYIYEQTKDRDMPAEIALLPFIESEYYPFAYSHVGAVGLWQVMPGTASGFGLKINWWYDGRRDIPASTNAALYYLNYLHTYFKGNWLLAIAAYDSGEGTVLAAINKNKKLHQPTDFWSLDLPKETTGYIRKLLSLAAIIHDPKNYGVHLPPINAAPYLKEVNVGSQIDIAKAATLADMTVSNLRALNPGYRRWATDPDGPYTLLIPVNKVDRFKEKLAMLPNNTRVTWRQYIVKSGDSLGKIAQEYRTTTSTLEAANNLKTTMIKTNQTLLIPVDYHGKLNNPIIAQRATVAEDNLPGPKCVVHAVAKGDTLQTIARHYGVSVREIAFWNKLKSTNSLTQDQSILVWTAKSTTPTNKNTHYVYKVVSGDNLGLIAHRFKTTIPSIKTYSHLKSNIIRVGQTLWIPTAYASMSQHYFYTIKPGDSLGKIALQNRITVADLKHWNPKNTRDKYLHLGKKLVIYKEPA